MGRIDELASEEFARWEQRGRGWQVWSEPIRPEPPFEEFKGYRLAEAHREVDDGRRPTFLASLFDSLEKKLNPKPPVEPEEVIEPEPTESIEPLTSEFIASLPSSIDIPDDALCAFLDSLHLCAEPTGFEILGDHEGVHLQFATSPGDKRTLERQLSSFLPTLSFTPAQEFLATAWTETDGIGFIVDFGLAHEFMLPLNTSHIIDPYVGLVSVLSELQSGEVGVFQVLFQGVQNPWPASIWRSITDTHGKALFVNRLQFMSGAKEKVESPLFGVVVRLAAKAESFDRSAVIVREMADALRAFARQEGNRLIPLHNDEFTFEGQERDLIHRQSRRGGMLLNREELLGFVHLPSDDVCAPNLQRERNRTKPAPAIVRQSSGLLLGDNVHAGKTVAIRLTPDHRVRHTHIIGASGSGKSTLLFNLIHQDINNGDGLAVLDPHGDLIDRILGIIPPDRIKDVVLLDLADSEYPIGFNILASHSELEKNLIASDLVSVLRRLSSSWGDQMDIVLQNSILAILESTRGGTLGDLRRFLIEPAFRTEFLQTVSDPELLYYWQKVFPQLTGNKSIGSVLSRLQDFFSRKQLRNIVTQMENKLDFGRMMDTGQIFLAKLSEGLCGAENSYLLGTLLVSKFQQIAMTRQAQQMTARRDFWLYIDEFDHFITPSMAEILKGSRKYRLGLTLAHQELHQLRVDPVVESAVATHPCTRIVFKVGDDDARKLGEGFEFFDAQSIKKLETFQAIARVERSDFDFNLKVSLQPPPDEASAQEIRKAVISNTRTLYATPRAQVETALLVNLQVDQRKPDPKTKQDAKAKADEVPKSLAPEIVKPSKSDPVEEVSPELDTGPAKKSTQSPDLGRGGAQHKAIQHRLQEEAIRLGFRATIEKEIPGGSIDLFLEKSGASVACEISVTTTIDHEVGNVRKCLKLENCLVAIVCQEETRLGKIKAAVVSSLGEEGASRVSYFEPDQCIAHIEALSKQTPESPSPPSTPTTKRRGYNITRTISAQSEPDRKSREKVLINEMTEKAKRESEK